MFRDPIGSPPKDAALLARWLFTHEIAVRTKHLFCITIEIGWHSHLDVYEQVSSSPSLETWHALLPDSIDRFGLRAGRYLKLLCCAVEKRYLQIRSEGGFSESDHHSVMEVIANALETVIRLDTDLNVDIPCWSSPLTSSALLVQP